MTEVRTFIGRLIVTAIMVFAFLLTTQAIAEETTVAPAEKDLPEAVMTSLKAKFPKAEITKWTQEEEDSVVIYDIEFTQESQKFEADIGLDGSIHNWERAITTKDLPPAVWTSAQTKYTDCAAIEIMEVIEVKDGKDVLFGFELLLEVGDGKMVELTFDPKGKILEEDAGSEG